MVQHILLFLREGVWIDDTIYLTGSSDLFTKTIAAPKREKLLDKFTY